MIMSDLSIPVKIPLLFFTLFTYSLNSNSEVNLFQPFLCSVLSTSLYTPEEQDNTKEFVISVTPSSGDPSMCHNRMTVINL